MQVFAVGVLYYFLQGEYIHIGFPLLLIGLIFNQSCLGMLMILAGIVLCCL